MAVTGKLVVVCGGGSGIGKAMALHSLVQEAKVVVLDKDAVALKNIRKAHPEIITYELDVTDSEQVHDVFTKVEQTNGPIYSLVHTAAIMPGGAFRQMGSQQINQIMAVNYQGMVNVTQTVLPFLLARNAGQLVVLGSVAGVLPLPHFGAYGASKLATNFYMQVLMAEHADSEVQFLLVCPAAVDTPLIDQATEHGPWFLRKQASGFRIANTDQIVRAIDKALRKKQKVIYPGDAWWIQLFYRWMPGFSRWMGQKLS